MPPRPVPPPGWVLLGREPAHIRAVAGLHRFTRITVVKRTDLSESLILLAPKLAVDLAAYLSHAVRAEIDAHGERSVWCHLAYEWAAAAAGTDATAERLRVLYALLEGANPEGGPTGGFSRAFDALVTFLRARAAEGELDLEPGPVAPFPGSRT